MTMQELHCMLVYDTKIIELRMLITWDNKLNTGIGSIAAQHKKLVEIINGLHTAIQKQHTRAELGDILIQLSKYADYHFATEEKHFKKHGLA